jgi:uncharacterized membrane protein
VVADIAKLSVGVVWLNHHRIFIQVHRVHGPLLMLNLNVLLWTALVPFPTAVVAEHLGEGGEPAQTAVAVYGAVFLVLGLSFGAMSPGSPATTGCWASSPHPRSSGPPGSGS